MNVDRLLRLAEALFAADTRRDVFEPLAADFQRELANTPASRRLRARWYWALVVTFLACAPRVVTSRLPQALVIDLLLRGIAFGTLAFALFQWLEGRQVPILPRSGAATLGASFSFVVFPVVWRLRVSTVAADAARRLAFSFVAATALLTLLLADGGWLVRVAAASAAPWLGLCAWRYGDPERVRVSPLSDTAFGQAVMVSAVLTLSTWPVKLALGLDPFSPQWSGDRFVYYGLGVLIMVSMRATRRPPSSAAGRSPQNRLRL